MSSPVLVNAVRFCCQITYSVLPGAHSHRITTFERRNSRLKSRLPMVKLVAPSVTRLDPSACRVMVVPSVPYVRRSRASEAGSSPKSEYRPLAAKGSA